MEVLQDQPIANAQGGVQDVSAIELAGLGPVGTDEVILACPVTQFPQARWQIGSQRNIASRSAERELCLAQGDSAWFRGGTRKTQVDPGIPGRVELARTKLFGGVSRLHSRIFVVQVPERLLVAPT